MAEVRAHLIISGRVQGVYYRFSTEKEAKRLGLTGWVRNLPNGDVEAVVEGEQSIVDQMIKWCWEGPSVARVDSIQESRESATDEFTNFSTRY